MSKVCSLTNSVINLAVLREDNRRALIGILDSLSDNTCIVLDPDLAGPLNHILTDGTAILKEHGVKDFKELSWKVAVTTCDNILYLVRPAIHSMQMIARHIKENGGSTGSSSSAQLKSSKSKSSCRFHVYFVPRKTLVCEEVLKTEGVYGSCNLGELQLDLIPFDDDVLTLELDSCFRECYLEGDKTSLMTVAKSIMKLQSMFGVIPKVKFKGNLSKIVWKMMMRLKREQGLDNENGNSVDAEIDTLILLDRKVDMVTPMCSPLTYEGLIDEVIGISNGFVKLDPEILADEDGKDKKPETATDKKGKIAVALNSNDSLYAEIRDFNVEQLGCYLQEKAKEIRERYDEFRRNKDASISEIHEFVKRIPGLKQNYQSLQQHINIAELIKHTTDSKEFRDLWQLERTMLEGDTVYEQIEEAMAIREPLMKVLRLLCMQSLTNGGLKSKNFDLLRRELLQSYGFELLFTLNNLEKLGMLRRRESSWVDSNNPFSSVRRSLRLINDTVNVRDPDDIAYVTAGYAPLSVRLVESAMKPNGWASIQESMRQLPGPTAEVSQLKQPDDEAPIPVTKPEGSYATGGDRKVMLVFFIGGVTFMEISALRFLCKQQDCPYEIIVATTKLISGNSLMKTLVEDIKSGLA